MLKDDDDVGAHSVRLEMPIPNMWAVYGFGGPRAENLKQKMVLFFIIIVNEKESDDVDTVFDRFQLENFYFKI